MLAHELAHLARRDPLWLAFASVVERVFWIQPLNRIARRRSRPPPNSSATNGRCDAPAPASHSRAVSRRSRNGSRCRRSACPSLAWRRSVRFSSHAWRRSSPEGTGSPLSTRPRDRFGRGGPRDDRDRAGCHGPRGRRVGAIRACPTSETVAAIVRSERDASRLTHASRLRPRAHAKPHPTCLHEPARAFLPTPLWSSR